VINLDHIFAEIIDAVQSRDHAAGPRVDRRELVIDVFDIGRRDQSFLSFLHALPDFAKQFD